MNIFASQKYILRLDELRNAYNQYFQKEKSSSTRRHYFIGVLIFFLYIAGNIAMSAGFSESEKGLQFIALFPVFLIACVVLPILYSYLRKKALTRTPTKKEIASVRRKHGKEIDELEQEMRRLTEVLKQSELPAQYHYAYAINWMIDAITSKRADTLKEVINLYEDFLQKERHNQSIVDALSNIRIIYY